jgi:hypothetical protein
MSATQFVKGWISQRQPIINRFNARTVIDAIQEMAHRGLGDQFFTVMKTSRSTLFDSANDDPEGDSDDSDGTSYHSLHFIDVDVPLLFEEEHL